MGFFTASHMKFQMCEDNKRSKENYWLTCTEVDTYALTPFWSRHFLGTQNAKGELTLEIFGFWDSVLTMKTHNVTDFGECWVDRDLNMFAQTFPYLSAHNAVVCSKCLAPPTIPLPIWNHVFNVRSHIFLCISTLI